MAAQRVLELEILELFERGRLVVLGPTDVERLLGVSKGTVSAHLKFLAEAGYLRAVGGGRYQPGPKMFALAIGYLGLCLAQIDETRKVLDVNLAEVRSALGALAGAMGAAGGSAKGADHDQDAGATA
jgi:DNA-binding transcriptional ArsR family regulator